VPWEVFHDQERAAMFRFHGKRAFVGHMAGTRRIMIMMNDPSLTREEDTPFDAGYTALAAQAQAQAGLGAGARAGARVEWSGGDCREWRRQCAARICHPPVV
jgi:hypothetical protein